MALVSRTVLLLGLAAALSGTASAQECPTPTLGSDGSWTIHLPTVELKLRPGATSSELALTQISPISGETETQRATITRDGPVTERAALLQVNRYDFDLQTYTVNAQASAVLAAGYTSSGALNIGYGAQEGGFLVLIDGDTTSSGCYPYPQNAAFGDWTKAISVIGTDINQIKEGVAALRGELEQCRAQNGTLTNQIAGLQASNDTLRSRVRLLEGELADAQEAAARQIFDLRRVIRAIFNEAQDGVKVRYPGDRKALLALRKQLVVARKANRKNVNSSANVITATRDSIRR